MKNIKYIAGLFVALAMTSCEDFLEAPAKSTLEESVIFSTPDLARGAVHGIYLPIGETNSYRGRYITYYGVNTDIEWWNATDGSGSDPELASYIATANNTRMNTTNNAWAMMYSGIERANICIEGLRTYGNPEPGTELGYLLGEALTLRAFYYADLMKAWGDVVARFEPITTETTYLPKSSRDDIYKQLLSDLEEAATLVPWPGESSLTSTSEDINKAFVKGFRARLALVASGYSEYSDGVRRSNDPELSVANMYALARQECLDVYSSGSVSLDPSFESVFRDLNEEVLTAGRESLWEIPFAEGRGRVNFTFAVPHASVDQYTAQPRGGSSGPLPFVFYDFDVKDTRRDVSCVPYSWDAADQATGIAQQKLEELDTWYFGKFRYEWMDRYVTSSNDDGVNKIYMRYAEIVLMLAEIENELNGPAAAAPYLKEIRQRAFESADWTEKVDNYVDALTTKDAMFNAIVEEHKFEFLGEMERKQTLIRWNLLKTKMDEAKTKMYALRDRTGEYSDVPERVYYRFAADGESLEFYGFNRGETADMSADYESSTSYVNAEDLVDDKIETLYRANPDENQFWPIWEVFILSSNGMLTND